MRTGSLCDLVALPDMPSEPTLRGLIRARSDFPVLRHGDRRSSYLFDLDAAAAFVRANWHDRRVKPGRVATVSREPTADRSTLFTGKLWELAAIPDMPSEPTLRAFIRSRSDFPVLERGRKGASYLFDLDAAAAFVRANWRDLRPERSGTARAARDRRAVVTPHAELPLFDLSPADDRSASA